MRPLMSLPIIIVIICLAGFTQGMTGFGFGLIAMPLLLFLMNLKEAAALTVLLNLIVCGMTFFSIRGHYSLRQGLGLVVGACLGVPLGIYALVELDQQLLLRILGAVMLAFSANELSPVAKSRIQDLCRYLCRKVSHPTQSNSAGKDCWLDPFCNFVQVILGRARRIHLSPRLGLPIGLISGGLSGAFSMGGPPVVAFTYSQPWSKEQIVAVLQVVFGLSALLRLVCLGSAGLMGGPLLVTGLWSIVPLIAAIFLGQKCFTRIPQPLLREVTFVFLGVMGLKYLFFP